MKPVIDQIKDQFDPRFKIFHELMRHKVREVLLISTPYDAWIMEEDCRLSEAIVNEYRGLNLSHPPRLNWVSSPDEAAAALDEKRFDLAIIIPHAADLREEAIVKTLGEKAPGLPVILLCHRTIETLERFSAQRSPLPFGRSFLWSGDTKLLLALIKNVEDQINVIHDTSFAGIRVIIFVEDSPEYMSALLPILYRELVAQTQAVIGEGLNEDHRLLAMRARPKILVASSYEQAMALFQQYESNVLGVISDVRFFKNGEIDGNAGIDLLRNIKYRRFDIPLLLMSAEPENAEKAANIPAVFIDKNSPTLLSEVRSFFRDHLGFGPFVFRLPGGARIGQAENLKMLETKLRNLQDESFVFHTKRNDFSRWLFARGEIELASRVRPIRDSDFADVESHRRFLASLIHMRRMNRQKGVVGNFDPGAFDIDFEFLKIGNGSLGGKARGLAFMSSWLHRRTSLAESFGQTDIFIPQTLVITTEGFETFVEKNGLGGLAKEDLPDEARMLASTYIPEERRIRDSTHMPGHRVITFAQVLKYGLFPLANILNEILALGREGMGCPVEMEFSADLPPDKTGKPQFAVLQIRPMSAREEMMDVDISSGDISTAFCMSKRSLGNTVNREISDIVYVRPDSFDPARTAEIAREIGRMNASLVQKGSKFLLIGPGRWGSADHWLGIPVQWSDICGVGAIVETTHPLINAEPSQGSHFFHNMTSLGINYFHVDDNRGDIIDWQWIQSLSIENEAMFMVHASTGRPITVKVDGRNSRGVLLKP